MRPQYHCDTLMRHERTPLRGSHVQHDFTCPLCRHHEREIRTEAGVLLCWQNLDRVARGLSTA